MVSDDLGILVRTYEWEYYRQGNRSKTLKFSTALYEGIKKESLTVSTHYTPALAAAEFEKFGFYHDSGVIFSLDAEYFEDDIREPKMYVPIDLQREAREAIAVADAERTTTFEDFIADHMHDFYEVDEKAYFKVSDHPIHDGLSVIYSISLANYDDCDDGELQTNVVLENEITAVAPKMTGDIIHFATGLSYYPHIQKQIKKIEDIYSMLRSNLGLRFD